MDWMWGRRVWIAGVTGVGFVLSTLYVLWAVQDLPDPSQDVLAAGDVVVLDRNGRLIEDWNPAGHYHVNFHLNEMGKYAPAATLAAEDPTFYRHGAIDICSRTGARVVRPRRPLRARPRPRAVRARRHGDNRRPITGRGGHGV